jgi:hypothetical protein
VQEALDRLGAEGPGELPAQMASGGGQRQVLVDGQIVTLVGAGHRVFP